MLFNSYIFIFLFLPICIAGYYLFNHYHCYKTGKAFLLGMSLWFYGYNNPWYLFVISGSIVCNYLFIRGILSENRKYKKLCMVLGVILNVLVLFAFKYVDFVIDTINGLFCSDFSLYHIVLPLGISFFTFQQISSLVDAYRNEIAACSILDYACFVAFFPQLVAGPIVSHDELLTPLVENKKKHINWENITKGVCLFIYGFGKKILIADALGAAVNYGFASGIELSSLDAILVIFAYTFQIYFDFSGYCDMALGIGKMFNLDLPRNFKSPYKALSIKEFWDRWHMTLTRFLTKYIYIPLGGNRKGTFRTYANILIVFAISGLWHGANWTFVVWGILHGLAMVLYRMCAKSFDRLPKVIRGGLTFIFVAVAWTIFRADSLDRAAQILQSIFCSGKWTASGELLAQFSGKEMQAVYVLFSGLEQYAWIPCLFVLGISVYFAMISKDAWEKSQKGYTMRRMTFLAVVFLWGVFSLGQVSTFLYFNF